MRSSLTATKMSIWQLVSISVLLVAGCASMQQSMKVTLTGAEEAPPVTTSATGSGTITIGTDKSVSGSVTTSGIVATAAHIHEGKPGTINKAIIWMTKTSDNVWTVVEGAKLTDSQYESYKAGNLYVNVHSAAHPRGEIRAQLKP